MGAVILVTGGAGYVGSHAVLALRSAGHEVLVADDLSEGHRPALLGAPLRQGSLLDETFLSSLFASARIDGVMHFAARCYVGESVRDPGRYYELNVGGTRNLLAAMVAAGCKRIVFSSSCATYGEPARTPITEDFPQVPVNPYGRTKLVCEWLLQDFHRAHGVDGVALRYFNAAGADPEARIGEDHHPETHLIPLCLMAAAGHGPPLEVYGSDYPTPDGTCIRDYVHVADLADAHVLAMDRLLHGSPGFAAFNLGSETGSSVRAVIRAAEAATGRPVPHRVGARRPGDPPVLVGSSQRARSTLGWRPRLADIDSIVATAWRWHRARPRGYGDG